MATKTGSKAAAQQHPSEVAEFDVVTADGLHHVEHGLVAVARALSGGGIYAEQLAWNTAMEQQHRVDAEVYRAELTAGGGL